MRKSTPKVLIVILNYGTYDLTIHLVKHLKKLKYSNYAIMVIDNCSPNESEQVLRENAEKLDYIFYANAKNAGYAAGNNIGIRYGIEHEYNYTWILNNDVELRTDDILDHMVQIAEQNTDIACVGPKIYSLNGSVVAPYCRRPSLWSYTLGIGLEKKFRTSQKDISQRVYRVYGCCMLLKNSVMHTIDCMDERTFLYGEEDILAERMRNAGYMSFYDADVAVTHKESASMKQMSTNRKKLQIGESRKSRELYLKEYRQYNIVSRELCHIVAALIAYLR
ncbi:MAG: glycosyltransferase family 2 protein [Eubacteriales bacterium]|nr:glycosyltransferase family 2 protein [Eubacteriales bacterium]